MPTVDVHQAKAQLSRCLALAEGGEEVVIARRGEPVARKPKDEQRFAMVGRIVVDDGILAPLPEAGLALWEGKAYRGWCSMMAAVPRAGHE